MNPEQLYIQLFKQYYDAVYQQALRMLHSEWFAEEVAQEVFIKLWIHRAKINAIQDIGSWLFIVTKRKVYDHVSKLGRRRKLLADHQFYTSAAYIEDAVLTKRCEQLLAEAQRKLSPRLKQVYILKHIKGYNRKEIAQQLNISETTVVFHIKRSTALVKQHIFQSLDSTLARRA